MLTRAHTLCATTDGLAPMHYTQRASGAEAAALSAHARLVAVATLQQQVIDALRVCFANRIQQGVLCCV